MAQETFEHPRGIITMDEVGLIQERIKREPYRRWYEKIKATTLEAEENLDTSDPYEPSYLASKQAQLYILSGKEEWAEKCWNTLAHVINDPVYFNDPISRGLTRATQLFGVALCYDFCYAAWSDAQRRLVNDKLFQVMLTTNSNMGFSANYAMESNWNGVRWGSALLAALVYDDYEKKYEKSPALPFIWDIQKRIKDHIARNVFPGGWSAENLSYHGYNWSFLGPALIANRNSFSSPHFELQNYAPHAVKTLWGWSTSSSSIPHPRGKGTQPDFSDDDPQTGYALAGIGLGLYPKAQLPALKWMHDYLLDTERIDDERGYLFYSICWYPDEGDARNPADLGWSRFVDERYGTSVWRNRFRDDEDVIVAFTAPQKRVPGHKGPDNLSFRILGFGNIWVVGGGRTSQIAGQTNLFPHRPEEGERFEQGIPASTDFVSGMEGDRFFASASGSCMGTIEHRREVQVAFLDERSALVEVRDRSKNGKYWRLNTPEFNEVEVLENGFTLRAPNGAIMRVTAPREQIAGAISVSRVKYGGNTVRHNRGVGFGDRYWAYNKAIDIPCDGDIDVRIELSKSVSANPD